MIVVRHQHCLRFIVGHPVFVVVALCMQGGCLVKYEANNSETAGEG